MTGQGLPFCFWTF